MREKRFYRRWKRGYLRGLKTVAEEFDRCRKTGDAEVVHALRVAIRRTRLFALMGRAMIGREKVSAFREWAQRLADALSTVRDHDVMIEWVQRVCPEPELVRELQRDRDQAWQEVRWALKAPPPLELKELRELKGGAKCHRKIAARYKKISTATREIINIDAAGFERLDPNARHDFRRAVRRLKYLQELDKESKKTGRLAKLQLALGELQNAQAIIAMLGRARNRSGRTRRLMQLARQQESEWLARCRRSVRQVVHCKVDVSVGRRVS